MQRLIYFLCLGAATMIAPAAWSATIVYVDATPNITGDDGNTTINGALVDYGVNATQIDENLSVLRDDGMWNYRGGTSGNETAPSGYVWESDPSTSFVDDTAPLITTIELAPGTYNLFGLTSMVSSNYDVAYSLNGVDYEIFMRADGIEGGVAASSFTTYTIDFGSLDPGQGLSRIYVHSIAQVSLPAGGPISVYVQGPDEADGGSTGRTRYIGLGYELVPEPSSISLLAIGLIAFRFRKRKPLSQR